MQNLHFQILKDFQRLPCRLEIRILWTVTFWYENVEEKEGKCFVTDIKVFLCKEQHDKIKHTRLTTGLNCYFHEKQVLWKKMYYVSYNVIAF